MFDGGVITFYSVSNSSGQGKMPKKTYTPKNSVCYENRTVGINRYSVAMQFDVQLSHVCRTPAVFDIDTSFIAVLKPYSHEDGAVYKIYQIQQTTDEDNLPCTDFSLQRLEGINADEIISNQ